MLKFRVNVWVTQYLLLLSLLMTFPANSIDILNNADAAQSAFIRVAKEAMPAVVNISTTRVIKNDFQQQQWRDLFGDEVFRKFFDVPQGDYKETSLGSGVVVDERGYILTNYHVVNGASEIVVRLSDSRNFKGKIIGSDPKTDLSVVKIDAKNLSVIKFGDSSKIDVGQWAIAIGSPFGFSQTLTVGIISAIGRSQMGLLDYEDFIQTDAAINPGNSGGALLNISGELVGINTAIFSRTGGYEGVGFAIPVNMAKTVMGDLIKYGKITRGWLGIYIQQIDDKLAAQFKLKSTDGVLVVDVARDGPAVEAGMKRGDVIIQYGGKKVTGPVDLRNMVAASKIGSEIPVVAVRSGKEVNFKVKVALIQEESQNPPKAPTAEVYNKLGLAVQNMTSDLADKYGYRGLRGVIVSGVAANSAAAEVGLLVGDLIVEINQTEVKTTKDFNKILGNIKKGARALLLVKRGHFSYYVVIDIIK